MNAKEFLDAVDARAAAATDGPWECTEAYNGDPSNGPTHHEIRGTVGRDDEVITVATTDLDRIGGGDAAFIASTRTDVPRMSAALRAVLAATCASDDGSEYEHEHDATEGYPECPACFAADVRAAINKALV